MKSKFVRISLAVATVALVSRGIFATACDIPCQHLQAVISDSRGRNQSGERPVQERWHPADETADPHKVLDVAFDLTPEGSLKPSRAWEHDSWKILDSPSEDELKARLQKESMSDLDPDSRTIGVRVYDSRGQVIFRTAARLWFVHNSSNGRNHIRPYVIITLPVEIRGRMETEAVDARVGHFARYRRDS